MPKSITFTAPSRLSMTLAGLMSRCTIPCRCEKSSASQMSAAIQAARRGDSGPCAVSTSRRVPPSTYSMTMYGTVPSESLVSPVSNTATIAGWFSEAALCASRRNRTRKAGSRAKVTAQDLDRDIPTEPQVAGPVHLGHGASTDSVADQISAPQQVAGFRPHDS